MIGELFNNSTHIYANRSKMDRICSIFYRTQDFVKRIQISLMMPEDHWYRLVQ